MEQLQLLQGKLSDALDARRAAEQKAMEQAGRLGAAQAEAAELGSRLREQQVLAGGASAAAAELRQKLCTMVAKQAEAMVVRQATLLDALDAAMAPHLSEDVPSYFSALVSSGRARLDRSRQLVETATAESKAGGGAEGGVARPVTELVHDMAAQLGSMAGALQTVVLGAARAAAEAAAEPQMSTLPPLEYGQGDVLLQKRLHAVRKDLALLAQRAGASSSAARAQHEVHTSPHTSLCLPTSPYISQHEVHTPCACHARTVTCTCTCHTCAMHVHVHAHTRVACMPRAHATHSQVDRLLAEHEVLRQSLIDSKLKHMSAEQELALLHKEQARRRGT